jgi:hypothetical protein
MFFDEDDCPPFNPLRLQPAIAHKKIENSLISHGSHGVNAQKKKKRKEGKEGKERKGKEGRKGRKNCYSIVA